MSTATITTDLNIGPFKIPSNGQNMIMNNYAERNNLVVETDSSPQPFKAKRENWTEPRHLRSIVREIAVLKDLEEAYIEKKILSNMKTLLLDKWDVILPALGSDV